MSGIEMDASGWLRVVHSVMDAAGTTFDSAADQVGVPSGLREEVLRRHESESSVQIERIRGVDSGGPKDWFANWEPADGFYWPRQRQYLLDHVGRSRSAVSATDDDSNRVLSYLEDPRETGPSAFNVRGLVIGNVQSGKTENFSAVIAKAADVGYQVVIVLSGIHNGLRQQTQKRLERELGLTNLTPGVGIPEARRRWLSQTNSDIHGDFDPGTSDPNILQGNERVIFVVKKWHSVLRKLIEFVEAGNPPGNLPVLVIDDEADQASINTGGNRSAEDELEELELDDGTDLEEIDPSITNGLIRELLSKFQRVSYVAYTATPFANILIDRDAEDREVLTDLFPKDFILSLSPRPGYVGAERLFGRDAIDGNPEGSSPPLDVVRFIPENEMPSVLPLGVKVSEFEPSVPDSMKLAFKDWILATAGILARSGEDQPSTMLIHIHQRTAVQNLLQSELDQVVTKFRDEWRYDKAGGLRAELHDRWEKKFRPVSRRIKPDADKGFDEIEPHIDKLVKDGIPVLALNGDSPDVLDYDLDPRFKGVVIGGNRLSRGMTLEGLSVSFYVRRTPYFDTLLQMGRWFGYREWYVDLTRLWTTPTLAGWFRDLALREAELRDQVLQAELEHLSPKDVGLRIRAHPAMMVTAKNKMGAGAPTNISFAGTMVQTTRFKLDEPGWLDQNLEVARSFISRLGAPDERRKGRPIWKDVDADEVCEFLDSYTSVTGFTSFDSGIAAAYIRAQVESGELKNWTVAVVGQESEDDHLKTIKIDRQGELTVNAISRTRLKKDRNSIGVLTNPARRTGPLRQGDEEIDLTDEQIEAAREDVREKRFEKIRAAMLAQRSPDRGLILIYPISHRSLPKEGAEERERLFEEGEGTDVIGVAIGFPFSKSAATVEYVTGLVESEGAE